MRIPEPNPVNLKAHASAEAAVNWIDDIATLGEVHGLVSASDGAGAPPDRVVVLRSAWRWASEHRWMVAWIVWLLQFLALEIAAVRNPAPGDTLSENTWIWFSIKKKGKWWRGRRITLLSILAWLLVHLMSGGSLM